MSLDPALFTNYRDLNVGDRVRVTLRHGRRPDGRFVFTGLVTLIWFGIEEMCDIEPEDGAGTVTACRATGDLVERVGTP